MMLIYMQVGCCCWQLATVLHCLFVHFFISTVRLVVFIAYIVIISFTNCYIHIFSSSAANVFNKFSSVSFVKSKYHRYIVQYSVVLHLWSSLPSHVTAAPLCSSSAVILNHISDPFFSPDFWLFSYLNSVCTVTRHSGHYNRGHA